MAFEFNFNAIFREAAAAMARGLLVAPLHGIRPDGRCTCGMPDHNIAGASQRQCGKHPILNDWANHCAKTEDDIAGWEDFGMPINIGIILGPRSGIIDIEWDDEVAKAYAEEIGLTMIETPTYISGRSEHRLFRWDDRLSSCKAVAHPGGLEVRLGTGKLQSQSVLPPSWHWSGIQYRWKPTLGLDEVDFAPIPENLLIAIVNDHESVPKGRAMSKPLARTILHADIGEGSRHHSLLAIATKKVFRNEFYLRHEEQEDILAELILVNERRCKPPKTTDEVASILHSCVQYRRRMEERGDVVPKEQEDIERAAEDIERAIVEGDVGDDAPVSGYALHGLEWRPVKYWPAGEWLPGRWSIQMVLGDPPEIMLTVPAWADTPCKGQITFGFDEFRSAKAVANKVFSATRRAILDGDRGEWERLWRGQEGNSKRPKIAGLIEKLVEKKDRQKDIHVGTSGLRFATLAGYLMEAFTRATQPRDEEKPEPNVSGRPCWVRPDELWFKWAKTWEDIGRSHDVQSGERIRIRHMLCQAMGVEDFTEGRHQFGDVRHSYVIFSPAWVAAVQTLAEGGTANPPNTGEREIFSGEKSREKVRIPRLESQVV
jgi:hypothetical protein